MASNPNPHRVRRRILIALGVVIALFVLVVVTLPSPEENAATDQRNREQAFATAITRVNQPFDQLHPRK